VFQNTERFPWHIQFLQSFPELSDLSLEAYTDLVLADGARVWWGGALQPWPSVRHPISGEFGIYSFLIYGDPQGEATVTVDQIGEVYETLRSCAPALAELLVFVPGDIRQQDMVRRNEDAIRDAGLPFLMPNQLADGAETIGYSEGEGYGTLRIIPQGELLLDYGPRDVVVVEAAPNDISIVSGLVTAQPQNPASHVNLRLSEKGIPNAMLASAYESPWLRELDGQLVHIVVGENQVRIDPARLEDAEAFWEANQPDVPDPVSDLSVTALTPYADMGADDALAFGAKAANLAEIRNVLPPEHRVEGFAIPFGRYQEHLERNGIDNLIATRLADPRMTTDAAFKADALDEIRDAIRDTPLDPAFESALHAQLRAVYGDAVETRRIRFRSSTNVEDLDALTGAGLYDSRSGCLADDLDGDRVGPSHCLDAEERAFLETRLAEKQAELAEHPERTWLVDIIADIQGDLTEEKPVADAVRKVWRSMWNLRAFDERAYYGIAHTDAYMGIAVNPSFVLEQINAVGFTGLEDADGGQTLYRVVSQRGDESVVRPDDPTVVRWSPRYSPSTVSRTTRRQSHDCWSSRRSRRGAHCGRRPTSTCWLGCCLRCRTTFRRTSIRTFRRCDSTSRSSWIATGRS